MANVGQRNGDIRAKLALSQAEALNGTRRTLKLPGGRQIVVSVPAKAHDGQEIRLEGQGRPSLNGERGTLILTISLPTEPHPSNEPAETSTPYLSQRQSPINIDTTFSAKALPPRNAPPPQMSAPPPRKRRHLSSSSIILLIVCVLLVAGGSTILLHNSLIQPGQSRNQPTATTAAKTAGYLQANLTGTAKVKATTQILNNATAVLQQKLFHQLTSAQPTLNDPLHQQDSHRWEEDTKAGGGGCAFINGAYHASMSQIGFFASCYALSSNFSNFVYQVQMTILKGDRGGIIFRSNNSNTNFYLFRVAQDGSYDLFAYVNTIGSNSKSLAQGSSPAIHRGLNQPNQVTVVARGSSLTLYINQQYVTGVKDWAYSSGAIGIFADDQLNPTEVAFNNAAVWTL
jgi:hypothetical protein